MPKSNIDLKEANVKKPGPDIHAPFLVLLSPTKIMIDSTPSSIEVTQPSLLSYTMQLLALLRTYEIDDLKKRMRISDKIAILNHTRFASFPDTGSSPAILSYQGLQYQQLDAQSLIDSNLPYIQQHFRILSGLYGVLCPLDGISPYRLDMHTSMEIGSAKNLYAFWNAVCYHEICQSSQTILCLASAEYTKLVKPFLQSPVRLIEVQFLVEKNGVRKQEATAAKMLRGQLARWMIQKELTDLVDLKEFSHSGFVFDDAASHEDCLVFVRV